MARKLLSVIILFTMVLHCASRLGGLSYLYEKRHDFAYSIGLITEKPIAICSSDYDFGKGLAIVSADEDTPTAPGIIQSQEINLFFISLLELATPERSLVVDGFSDTPLCRYALYPVDSIFHPPLG